RLIERMQGLEAGRITPLFGGLDGRFAGAHAVALGDEGSKRRICVGKAQRQRMVRREGKKGSSEKRILPGRENLDTLICSGDPEENARALRAANPVFLHQPHPLWPSV